MTNQQRVILENRVKSFTKQIADINSVLGTLKDSGLIQRYKSRLLSLEKDKEKDMAKLDKESETAKAEDDVTVIKVKRHRRKKKTEESEQTTQENGQGVQENDNEGNEQGV